MGNSIEGVLSKWEGHRFYSQEVINIVTHIRTADKIQIFNQL